MLSPESGPRNLSYQTTHWTRICRAGLTVCYRARFTYRARFICRAGFTGQGSARGRAYRARFMEQSLVSHLDLSTTSVLDRASGDEIVRVIHSTFDLAMSQFRKAAMKSSAQSEQNAMKSSAQSEQNMIKSSCSSSERRRRGTLIHAMVLHRSKKLFCLHLSAYVPSILQVQLGCGTCAGPAASPPRRGQQPALGNRNLKCSS